MNYKKILPDVLAIAFFVAISVMYFFVPIRDGLVLTGHDHTGGVGSGVEMEQYRATHNGERTRWTNTLFCGMPTYQMSPSYRSTETLSSLERVYQLGLPGLSAYAAYVFMMLLGFYIMLRAFDFRVWMAALGAVLWAFSSYYFIIIQAGHIWKLLTLSFIPPTIGGMVLCYRGKYLLGIVVTGFFTAMQVLSNHVQMSYYFLFVIGLMSLAFLIDAIRQGTFAKWLKATLCFAIGGVLGVCINLSNLYHTWEYSKESMRGKSELTQKTKDPADQTTSGLERSYITMWSYGKGETWTLLVPNTKGGASQVLADNETAMKHARQDFVPVYRAFTQYWGEQPGTSGPVYVGAFVLMLFWLGFFVVKGPMKWCLIAATVLSILLSWGKNFMGFTDFFLDYVPMYDKFRTVASILVIAEFTIPLLAMLALKEVVTNPDCLRGKEDHISRVHYITISFALTGGVALLFWLMPDVFFGNYISSSDQMYMQQYVSAGYIPQEMAGQILANMSEMRRAMFTSDALRSFIVVAIGTILLLAYRFQKLKATPMIAGIILLCLVDMWGVNKRYLNDGMFSRPQTNAQAFPETEADKMILQDTDTYYRVLNLSVSTFNDNTLPNYFRDMSYLCVDDGSQWIDNTVEAGGKPWMNPFSETAVSYNSDIVEEISSAGFDKVVCYDFIFPDFRPSDAEYLGTEVTGPDRYMALTSAANLMYDKIMHNGATMLLEVNAADLLRGKDDVLQPMLLKVNTVVLNIDVDAISYGVYTGETVYEFNGTPAENVKKMLDLVSDDVEDFNVAVRVSGVTASTQDLLDAKDEIVEYGFDSYVLG